MKKTFFICDSDNYFTFRNKLYGYLIKDGQLNDDIHDFNEKEYYKYLGTYIVFKENSDSISIYQDANGSFGLFYYYKDNYYAISNSFSLLFNFLKNKNIELTLNKGYASFYLLETGYPHAVAGTVCNEINILRPDEKIILNHKGLRIEKGYTLEPVPLDSRQGLEIIDQWINKYLDYILSYSEYPVRCDISGGKDSRISLGLVLLIKDRLKNLNIFSKPDYAVKDDYEIAQKLANKFNFTLSSSRISDSHHPSIEAAWICSILLNLGSHAYPYFIYSIFDKPFVHIMGQGGENIRGYGFKDPFEYAKKLFSLDMSEKFFGLHGAQFLLKQLSAVAGDPVNQGVEPEELVHKVITEAGNRNHFGHFNLMRYLSNEIVFSPLLDKTLHSIKSSYDNQHYPDLMAAVISLRLHPELLDISFNNGSSYSPEIIEKAKAINQIKPLTLSINNQNKSLIKKRENILEMRYPEKIDSCFNKLYDEFNNPALHDFISDNIDKNYISYALKFYNNKKRHHPEQKIFKLLTFKSFTSNPSVIPEEIIDFIYKN